MENKLTRMAKLASANPKSWGIVDANEISGHRSVATVSDLYSLAGCILSSSYTGDLAAGRTPTGNDAIGQIWYVQDTNKYYKLITWNDPTTALNWQEVYIGTDYGKIDDVQVNGTSVVSDKIAKIDLTPYAKDADVLKSITSENAVIAVDGNKLTFTIDPTNTGSPLQVNDQGLAITLSLTYDSENKKIKLCGQDSSVISEINAKDFIKDGMIDSAKYSSEDHSLTLTFNTDAGKDPISIDLSELIDVYNGSSVKVVNIDIPEQYSDPAKGDSMDTALGKILKKQQEHDAALKAKLNELAGDATTDYVTTEVTTTDNGAKVSAKVNVADSIANATETVKALASAYQVKQYVDNAIAWQELN